MNLTIRRLVSPLVSTIIKYPISLFNNGHAIELLHTETKRENDKAVIDAICHSFRGGCSWDVLSTKFRSNLLTDPVVEKVLLQFKEPVDAKRALGFFHWSAKTKNDQNSIWSYCLTIHILIRARLLIDARALIESLLKNNVKEFDSRFSIVDSLLESYRVTGSSPLVFDLLVQGYAKLRRVDNGFDVCCHLSENGFSLSVITFNTLLHVAQKSDMNDLIWRVYEHMIEKRSFPNDVTIKILVKALCKEGKLKMCIDMLDRIHGQRCAPSVIVNTSLIFKIIEDGRIEEAMVLLKRLLQKNMILDTIAYSLVVFCKVKLGNMKLAQEVYEEMLKRGFHANAFVHTSFIGGYSKEGRIEEANHLLLEMESSGMKLYDETYNFLIEGCCRTGRFEESLCYCEKMVAKGLSPSCSVLNGLIKELGKVEYVQRTNAMLTLLMDKGFAPDNVTYSNLIGSFARTGQLEEALKLYYEMEYRSLSPGLSVFESLINGFCQQDRLEEAEKYLRLMEDRSLAPNVDTYETLIRSRLRTGDKAKALNLYNRIVSKGYEPSSLFCDVDRSINP